MADTPPNNNAKPEASKTPDPNDKTGTSQQPRLNEQLNNKMLNPDAENANSPAAAPGVVPTDTGGVRPVAEPRDPELASAGNEPEQVVSVRGKSDTRNYRLVRGKHRYQNAQGEMVVAQPGATVPLTRTEYDQLRDRFADDVAQ